MENRQADFVALASKAQQQLMDDTFPIDAPEVEWVLFLSLQPTFGNFVAWTVFSRAKRMNFLVRKRVWDRAFDGQRFFDPLAGLKYGWQTTPTITMQVPTLPRVALDKLLREGRALNIEPMAKRGIVIDGMERFLKLRGAFQGQFLSWNALPDGWEKLEQWVEKICRILDHA
jgi:hypothetical protein